MRVTDKRVRHRTRHRRRVTCVGASFVSRVSCLVSRVSCRFRVRSWGGCSARLTVLSTLYRRDTRRSQVNVLCACKAIGFCGLKCADRCRRFVHDDETCIRFAEHMRRSDALAARDDENGGGVDDGDPRPSKRLELTHIRDVDGGNTWDDYAYARTLLGGMLDFGFTPESVVSQDGAQRAMRVQIIGATTQCEWRSRASFVILAEYFNCDVEVEFIGMELLESGEDVVHSRDGERRYAVRLFANRGVGPRLGDQGDQNSKLKHHPDFIVAFNAGLEVYPEWKSAMEDILLLHFERARCRRQSNSDSIMARADGDTQNHSGAPPLLITDFNEEAARRASLFLKHVYTLVCADDLNGVQPRFMEPRVNRFRSSQACAYDAECVLPSYANAFVFGFIGLDI